MGVLLLALLVGHAWWLGTHYAEVAASASAPGYAIPTKQLAQEGHAWITPASPVQYIGPHFVETADGNHYVSRMAPGLAWISAPVYMFGGHRAAMYVNPLLASLTLLFLFLLCRRWIGGWFALLAALAYAANPTANYQAIHADAHTGATAFLVIGLFFLDGWARKPGPWKALLAGLAFGMAPAIQPAQAVCGIGVALVVLAKVWQEGPRWRQLFLLLVGAAIPLGIWVIHNHMTLGTWLPGRDPTSAAADMGWAGLHTNAISYLEDIGGRGAGLLLGLGLAGMVAMVCQRNTRLLGIGLLGILVPVATLAMLRDFNWGSLALFLPIFPLLTLGAFWVLRQLTLQTPRVGWPAALTVTALTIAIGLPVAVDRMAAESRGQQLAATVVKAAEEHLEKGSLVVCGPRLANPLEYAGWRIVDEDLIIDARSIEGRATEAAAKRSDDDSRQQRHYRAAYLKLSDAEFSTQVLEDVFEWADGKTVYWIGRADDFERFRLATEAKGQLKTFCEIEMPAPADEASKRGGWSTRPRGDGEGGIPSWQIPDDGQSVLVYKWLPEKTGPDSRTDSRKDK